MVKGVNKSIIEINDTGSEIFEKVVFYISPKFGNLSPKKLIAETDRFTFNFEKRSGRGYKSLRKRMLFKRRLLICGMILLGAAVIGTVLLLVL